ncbi:N-6 DNA methylase [Halalkalibacter alkaliphilus]|uniref:site-specific DNA-methyltransferase (adenine-specific) n=1 Tax=Halalkalibacter alkaliphilus TaxID=2917993 RepID=A0A9X2CRV0_9BACI|nr:N-6 DNA methylase [Halalkalibacter alkaliphilus]MCL7747041.1 SAM-dependent methyltransferase [Halalkalibacter alkaliphilus]
MQVDYLDKVKDMIDDLKAMSSDLGLSNTGDEYKIIGELFTYKFLNDKLVYDFENREDKTESFDEFVEFADSNTAKMKEKHLLKNLYHEQNKDDFHQILDKTLKEISDMNKDVYAIETVTGKKQSLFEPLASYIRDENKEYELAKRVINILYQYQFTGIYDGGFDYFSTIFEYLIKDYNKDSGKYAEYFTPLFAGNIMADILYDDKPVSNVSVYDPSAGSGTLLLSMANKIGTDKCSIYSQDISQKSTQFLRINLILNKLTHSLNNVIEGNTVTNPAHLSSSGELKTFDYIVSNPPFNMDFSAMVEKAKTDRHKRFFAGVPTIPKKKKDSMAIYLMFLQHIISSLSEKGKAAIVVPTGFVTAAAGIPLKIRKELIDKNMLRGVVHMPSSIFANTPTSVSILFLDRTKTDEKVMLLDASNLGTKTKVDNNQRILLSDQEVNKIITYFKNRKEEVEFSVLADNSDIRKNGYFIQAGQYVELKEDEVDENLDDRILFLKDKLFNLLTESKELDDKLFKSLRGENNNDR